MVRGGLVPVGRQMAARQSRSAAWAVSWSVANKKSFHLNFGHQSKGIRFLVSSPNWATSVWSGVEDTAFETPSAVSDLGCQELVTRAL